MSDRISTGLTTFDRLRGSLRREELVVLGGDSGSGCTSLAHAIARGAAEAGARVAMISTEMSPARAAERALAASLGLSASQIDPGSVSDDNRAAVAAEAHRLTRLQLSFKGAGDHPTAPWQSLDESWDLLVVDSLEGIVAESAGREEAMAARIRELKRLALEQRGTVLLTCHLGSRVAARSDPRPRLSDFGADGQVQADADLVLGLYREEQYRPDLGVAGAAELIILKDRNGSPAAVDLWFEPASGRFEDLADVG